MLKNILAILILFVGIFFQVHVRAQISCNNLFSKPREVIIYFDHYQNPYMDRDEFKKQQPFLKRIGVDLTVGQLRIGNAEVTARKYNDVVDELVANGRISGEDVIYFADTYVTPNGRLAFVKKGEAPSFKGKPFSIDKFKPLTIDSNGFFIYAPRADKYVKIRPEEFKFSNQDYFLAISQGYFPGLLMKENVLDELSQLGSFIDFPDAMAAFRKAADSVVKSQLNPIDQNILMQLKFINQDLMMLNQNAITKIQLLIARSKIQFYELDNLEILEKRVKYLMPYELKNLSENILKFHWENRLPYGSFLRNPVTGMKYKSNLDRLAELIQIPRLYYKRSNSNDAALREILAKSATDYLYLAKAISETTIHGWYSHVGSSRLPKDSPYFRFLCSQIRESREAYHYKSVFCE